MSIVFKNNNNFVIICLFNCYGFYLKMWEILNLSGDSVREFVNFYKLSPEEIIVVCDDINLPVGGIRIRKKGSDGGQKGLRSIIGQLGYDNFTRVRVGVGEKPMFSANLLMMKKMI